MKKSLRSAESKQTLEKRVSPPMARGSSMRMHCSVILLGCAILTPSDVQAASVLAPANADLQAGKADQALILINSVLQSDPNNAEANNLLCRVQYTLNQFDQAADSCQKAVTAEPNNSVYHDWLGRAIGERASRASFLSAYSLAKKTREEFETAVKLDARNADALADLGEFFEEAPGAVGGGIDKAKEILKTLDSVDSSRADNLRGEIAVKEKDLAAAEKAFKAAAIGSHPAIGWMELASFYRKQERWSDMLSAINSGMAAQPRDPHSAVALYNGAGVLERANREPELAMKMLSSYVASPDKTEEAPAFVALYKLARLKEKAGDSAGAARDRSFAAALAHEYKPPQEAKH